MASLSSLGIGSGLDAESIVTKLVAIEKQPAQVIATQNSKLETKVSTWGKIQSAFSALQDAAKALNKADFWTATTSSSSDASAVSVTSSAESAAGAYSVNVSALASAQYIASKPFAAKTSPVGQGEIRIQLGTYANDPDNAPPAATFNAKAAAQEVKIPIGPEDNTLEKIRDRINSANAGITASLVTDASGTRLIMRGSTGSENGFRVDVTEDAAAPGLSALAYDGTKVKAENPMSRTQLAGNAVAEINGISVSSNSNTFSNVLEGVSLTVGKVTSSPVSVNVTSDTSSIKKGIDTFVSAYNNVVSTIRVQTLYDEASKTAGPLQGDATARGLLSQIRSLMGTETGASSVFSRLPDIGLDIAKDGTLSTKSSKLNAALENLPEMKKFFANVNEADTTKNGIGQRVAELTKKLLQDDGAIDSKTDGLNSTIKRNKDKIERIEDRVALVEARLRAQYSALDTNVSKFSGLQSYVSAQLAALNKN